MLLHFKRYPSPHFSGRHLFRLFFSGGDYAQFPWMKMMDFYLNPLVPEAIKELPVLRLAFGVINSETLSSCLPHTKVEAKIIIDI